MSLSKALKQGKDIAQNIIQDENFDSNGIDHKTGETPAHILTKNDRNDLLKVLLAKQHKNESDKPNLDHKDTEGKVSNWSQLDSFGFGTHTWS